MICRFLIFSLIFIFSVTIVLAEDQDTVAGVGVITPTIDKDSKTGYFIPSDMEQCIDELDVLLPDDVKDSLLVLEFRVSQRRYFGITTWIKQNWDLNDSSQLVSYFSEFGFTDPDVIVQGIFRSYWNYLNDNPLRIEMKPSVYINNQNLFLKLADSLIIYNQNPAPLGALVPTDSTPQFIFMGNKFTLIDSLYDPIINLIRNNQFEPSDSLWYIWWPRVEKFGDAVEGFPTFLSQEDIDNQFGDGGSYNADYILIIEDSDKYQMKLFLRSNKYDQEFIDYINTKRFMSFYLIRKRDVHYFDY